MYLYSKLKEKLGRFQDAVKEEEEYHKYYSRKLGGGFDQ